MVELAKLLAIDDVALQIARQEARQISAWADPIDDSLSRAAEEFQRQERERWRSLREAAQIASVDLLSPARFMAEEMARQQAEMLRPFSLFDSQMKDAMNALSFQGAMQDAIAGLGLGAAPSWADIMNDAIGGIGLAADRSWKSTLQDTVNALGLASPFPWPERRQVSLPEPDPEIVPEPPAAPQIDNASLLQTFFSRLRSGELTVDELRAATQPGSTGPKVSDSEWPFEKVMLMWTGWQACKHKWTALRYLKEFRWNIQPSRMYKLFRENGLSSKLDTN